MGAPNGDNSRSFLLLTQSVNRNESVVIRLEYLFFYFILLDRIELYQAHEFDLLLYLINLFSYQIKCDLKIPPCSKNFGVFYNHWKNLFKSYGVKKLIFLF